MKALKEKRVSLRSLFRRSLVILSLLALAFAVASCGGSGGGTEEPSGPNGSTDPSGPDTSSGPYVTDIQVLKHPTMYSFEGAEPNLQGIQVAVYWSDKTVTIEDVDFTKDKEKNTDTFYVLPPVTILPGRDGTNYTSSCTAVSDYGAYYLYYKGESAAKPANLYIPAVVALTWSGSASTLNGATAGTEPQIEMTGGPIPAVFEDLPFDASSIKIKASYQTLLKADATVSTANPGRKAIVYSGQTTPIELPLDYGSEPSWATVDAGPYENRITSYPTAWKVIRAANKADTTSKLQYIPVLEYAEDSNARFDVDVKAFYYVDKLEYIDGTANLRNFYADEEDVNLNTYKAADSSVDFEFGKKIDWVKELKDAKAEFNVIYYTGPNQDAYEYFARKIDMPEYIRAMYTVDVNGYARATVPVVTGGSYNSAVPVTGIPNQPSTLTYSEALQRAVIGDWEDPVISCFYYNPSIKGSYGAGYFDVNGNGFGGTSSSAAWANAATVPLSGKILTFDHISDPQRKTNTGQNKEPIVILEDSTNPSAGTKWKTTVDDLAKVTQTYYDVYYVYVDQDNNEFMYPKPIPWQAGTIGTPTPGVWNATHLTGFVKNYSSSTNKPIDYTLDIDEQGEYDVVFYYPRSDNSWGSNDEITFYYDVIR